MDDKRCPVCGMSVEGYQTKCECGFEFEGKTDEEIKEIEKQTNFGKKVALIFAVPALFASAFAKAAFQNGYGLYNLLFCAAVFFVLGFAWAVYSIVKKTEKQEGQQITAVLRSLIHFFSNALMKISTNSFFSRGRVLIFS